MPARSLLVGLIVLATIGFVVGVSIEKADDHHAEPAAAVTEAGEEAGNAEAEEAGEHHAETGTGSSEEHSEFKPLGIDLESTPLIVLAAIGSLALAAAAWLKPRWLPGLLLTFLAMGVFAALDVAEVVHQLDIDETALGILAGIVALLHFAAAFVALRMADTARD